MSLTIKLITLLVTAIIVYIIYKAIDYAYNSNDTLKDKFISLVITILLELFEIIVLLVIILCN